MNANEQDLESLALRAGRGDRAAGAALREQLEPQLVQIVRHTLRSGRDTNPVAKCVLAEARRVAFVPRQGGWEAPESLVSQVARRICESVLAGLGAAAAPRRWALDTVANAS